jgi:inner membrane protein
MLYAMLYAILRSEDNALLMGSLLIFAVLGGVMLITRKFDWYRLGSQQTAVVANVAAS